VVLILINSYLYLLFHLELVLIALRIVSGSQDPLPLAEEE